MLVGWGEEVSAVAVRAVRAGVQTGELVAVKALDKHHPEYTRELAIQVGGPCERRDTVPLNGGRFARWRAQQLRHTERRWWRCGRGRLVLHWVCHRGARLATGALFLILSQEITILAAVCDLPNIVTLYEIWEDGNYLYLVMVGSWGCVVNLGLRGWLVGVRHDA